MNISFYRTCFPSAFHCFHFSQQHAAEKTAISSIQIMFAVWLNIKSQNGLLLIPLSSESTINVPEVVSVTNSVHRLRIQNMDYSVKYVYTC